MSATTRALQLRRLFEDDAALRLLRMDHAAATLALLGEHLGGDERRLAAEELYERVDADMEQLRATGWDLKGSARGYVAQWRNAGFLIRRSSDESRGETYELSSAALRAMRFVNDLEAPKQSATESRLTSLATQLRQLAIDTDPQSQRRLERLEEQRAQIDAQIEAVRAGQDVPLADDRAIERIQDLLDQAAVVPDDFARIRAEFESLNIVLREKIVDSDAAQRTVLDDIFRGVDLIAESDAGRTFTAFTDLVLDPALGAAFEDDVDRVLERDFSRQLTAPQRRLLRQFIMTLKARTAEIQDVTTVFARGLRRYVQSQDYQRDRILGRLIREARQQALTATDAVKPYQRIGVDLALTGVTLASAAVVHLHDPSEFDASAPVLVNETGTADREELRALTRLTEIDFDELTANINAVLEELATATVGEILTRFPATQGVASIVGLLSLAALHGRVDEGVEHVTWTGADGVIRHAEVVTHRFLGRVA